MSNEEIKKECDLMYEQIKNAEARLKELRSICKHEEIFEGLYSWRVGSIEPSIICSHCGSFIKTVFDYVITETSNDNFPKDKIQSLNKQLNDLK